MNPDANEFSSSIRMSLNSTNDEHLFSLLSTNFQLQTARSIFEEWNTAPTLSALTRDWSRRSINHVAEQHNISLVLYNISSLRVHLEDWIDYISSSFPALWALTGLHFDETANYQLASYFKSRYIIYYQKGSNSFGGVCLAVCRDLPHRLVPGFDHVENLIAADVFIANRTYTMTVLYSPPVEPVPIGDLNA